MVPLKRITDLQILPVQRMLRTALAKVKKPLAPYYEKKSISKPLILGAQTHSEGSKKKGLQLGDPHPFIHLETL
jgi:hypothetical protein